MINHSPGEMVLMVILKNMMTVMKIINFTCDDGNDNDNGQAEDDDDDNNDQIEAIHQYSLVDGSPMEDHRGHNDCEDDIDITDDKDIL